MHRFRILLSTMVLLLPASVWADEKAYSIQVCNNGQQPIDVATGFQDSDLITDYWSIDRWYHFNPGSCGIVFSRLFDIADGLGAALFPEANHAHVHLAFAFTDSRGVWGAGLVDPYKTGASIGQVYEIEKKDLKPSKLRFCISPGDHEYALKGTDPSVECGGSGTFLIPASIDYTPSPDYNAIFEQIPTTFHVAFVASDRAIPLGSGAPQTSNNSGSRGANSGEPSFGDLLLREMAKALADEGKKPLSPAEAAKQQAQTHAGMLGWVREDVGAYIAASKSGFNAYKKGEPRVQAGLRMWDSNTKPAFAEGCWVVQGDTTTFSCLLYDQQNLSTVNAAYAELIGDIAQSLPRDWTQLAASPFGSGFPSSKGYQSSSGAHGEVWITPSASNGLYELHFQMVTAAGGAAAALVAPPPAEPIDDPIGQGGFIKPPQ